MAKDSVRGVRTKRIEKTAALFRLLGDASRCALLLLLDKQLQGLYVHEVATALNLTHSAASHQLGTLEANGIVCSVREGQLVKYRLAGSAASRRAIRLLRGAER